MKNYKVNIIKALTTASHNICKLNKMCRVSIGRVCIVPSLPCAEFEMCRDVPESLTVKNTCKVKSDISCYVHIWIIHVSLYL